MGCFGPGLRDSDTAFDLQADLKRALRRHKRDVVAAFADLEARLLARDEVETDAVLALADMAAEHDALSPRLRERAFVALEAELADAPNPRWATVRRAFQTILRLDDRSDRSTEPLYTLVARLDAALGTLGLAELREALRTEGDASAIVRAALGRRAGALGDADLERYLAFWRAQSTDPRMTVTAEQAPVLGLVEDEWYVCRIGRMVVFGVGAEMRTKSGASIVVLRPQGYGHEDYYTPAEIDEAVRIAVTAS